MAVDKVHEMNSLRQNKWLEKYINLNTQKRNKAKTDYEKDFYKFLTTLPMENQWKSVVIE